MHTIIVKIIHKVTKLKWVVASESNVDHFNYENAKNGINYYRLKTVNIDQTVSYSTIIVIQLFLNTSLNIFPNPSS